ncbi:hypothetical protein LSUB1_G004071 [Lachnellula subtilissima]|uniref:Uncharacterized protein n=1 Tax=Lachnellula subtilissima TaxID=602034 RepID=A0A8H8UBZ9_9HELO|nr:hypothetical protein LSUB1_G004071 [Lachnellula subtilissima]
MSDPNPSPPALGLVSANMIDDWSYLLPGPERSAFVKACIEAGADEGRLQSILTRYFSMWKTTLMADDLSRLQMLATAKYEQIRCYVKVIWLEDETDKIGYDEVSPSESFVIWPRLGDGRVVAEALGVELLKAMLASQQLRPDRLEIRDKRSEYAANAPLDPETAAILARNILDGADLAITAVTLRALSAYETMIATELSVEHQGQGIGFSLVRKADLCFTKILNPYSYWADRILLHGPALKELSLSVSQPSTTPHLPPFISNNTVWPALEKFELSMSRLPISTIMAILSNSQQSLTGISFVLMTLGEGPTWADVLSRIANEFPHLTWFELTNISEGHNSERRINFMSLLDKDLMASEPYKSGLKMKQRGTGDYKHIARVQYEGPSASHVLGIVAECAVAKPRS